MRHAPFRNISEIGMLFDIFAALGTPARDDIVGGMGTAVFPKFKAHGGKWGFLYGTRFRTLIDGMLTISPNARFSAETAAHWCC
eukprot:12410147-Karenia_brevis.AAC.1